MKILNHVFVSLKLQNLKVCLFLFCGVCRVFCRCRFGGFGGFGVGFFSQYNVSKNKQKLN